MEQVRDKLKAVLEETRFAFDYSQYGTSPLRWGEYRDADSNEFRDVYLREVEGRNIRISVAQQAPAELMADLIEALRVDLEPVIDPGTGRIGHTFRIQGGAAEHAFGEQSDLLCRDEYYSDLPNFARALVQAAAITGVQLTTDALAAWSQGEAVEVLMATVVSGLLLDETVTLGDGIELVPLGLSTAGLPRLPMFEGDREIDYLGLTLVRLALSASPAVFRRPDGNREIVRAQSSRGINLQLLRDALSLVTNRHVALGRIWLEYPTASGFCVSGPTSSIGSDRPNRRQWKSMRTGAGPTTITLPDDTTPDVINPREVEATISALQGADRKLQIAVDRWRRSIAENAQLEDRYIDLRVALEALYLKDFVNEHSQEMRFRLALFGAWHLGGDFNQRRSIRKTLRDAYDTASKAVHEGDLPTKARPALSAPQDLCRKGILKLLGEGPPKDWGELVLGADED